MDFENILIDSQKLPRAEDVELQPIESNFHKVIVFNQIITWLIVVVITIISIYFIKELKSTLIISILFITYAIIAFISWKLNYLSFQNKGYAVRTHDILYQTGWFVKKLHVCPLNRIQHCSISSGIIERKFGLSKLNIFTAGGDDSDISIPGLLTQQAEDLRELISKKNLLDNAE